MSLSGSGPLAPPRAWRAACHTVELNIAAICAAMASAYPQRESIVFRDRRLTWAQVDDRCRRLANLLVEAGLGTNDRVALYLHNGNEYLEGMLGSYMARCAPTNINYRYTAGELAYVLNDSDAKVIVHHACFADTLADALTGVQTRPLLLQIDDSSAASLGPDTLGYEAALAGASPVRDGALERSWSGDDWYLCYTGGTTGMPKGAMWRQADFLVAALTIRRRDGTEHDSIDEIVEAARRSRLRALPAPPLMHGAAHWNAIACWAAGGTVVIQDHPDRLDPADLWRVVQRERATSMVIVGDAFARPLIDEWDRAASGGAPYDASSLRHLISGGAILGPAAKAAIVTRLPHVTILDMLGSSESGRQGVSATTAADAAGPAIGSGPGSAVAPRFELSPTAVVLDESLTRRLSPDDRSIGWLAQSGRVPLGYLGDPDKTARTFPTVDGIRYAVPGDRARFTDDGTIELLGRDSVTVNTGGEKVFVEEVETVLKTHPDVLDAVVCGRPSPRWGQEVVAIVSLVGGCALDAAALREHCRISLAGFKVPKAVIEVDAVVRSPSGKADYRWAVEQTTTQG